MIVNTIDLKFLGARAAVAAFAVPDENGFTLVECGPFSTNDNLLAGLAEAGIDPSEVHTLLLTHIHFDHAGAAWWWARRGVTVYVHPRGRKHLVDPGRLYASAARIYGEARMEELWGRMERIPPEQVVEVADRAVLNIGGKTWTAHHTPGHASHHIAWQVEGVVFTGDVGGVSIYGGPVVPPCPPPDINVTDWEGSIARLRSLNATSFYLTHYGKANPTGHLDQLVTRLERYVDWVAQNIKEVSDVDKLVPGFTEMVERELRESGADDSVVSAYRAANPPYMSVTGITRWLAQRR